MKKRKILLLALIVLIMNLVWEFSHSGLYNDLTGISSTLHLILASFGDLLFVFLIFALVSFINRSIKWAKNPDKKDYLLITIFGLVMATLIEVVNLNLGRWSYTQSMPTIFTIGLSPLLQLATTGILSLIIFRKFNF